MEKKLTVDEIYEDWSGGNRLANSCHSVHDSAEAIEFAEYYHNEMMCEIRKNTNYFVGEFIGEDIDQMSILFKTYYEAKKYYDSLGEDIAIGMRIFASYRPKP